MLAPVDAKPLGIRVAVRVGPLSGRRVRQRVHGGGEGEELVEELRGEARSLLGGLRGHQSWKLAGRWIPHPALQAPARGIAELRDCPPRGRYGGVHEAVTEALDSA